MSERPHHARRQRTRFSEGQLRVLRDVFNETKRPDWDTVQALAARLQLDVAVIKTWFKNNLVRWKKQQQEKEPNPKPGGNAPDTFSVSSRGLDDAKQEPQGSSGDKGPGVTGDPALSSQCALEPCDIHEIHLEDVVPPWASMPYNMDQLVELYALPGDDDPDSLDRYLLPGCLH
uniref:Leucine-twenty homeobox n=1 Tax=Castor canadensis TaxID=51338 RepID=A0A8B7TVD2_CASCN|nr:leucine-twenty homeobox [Castor canadensis]